MPLFANLTRITIAVFLLVLLMMGAERLWDISAESPGLVSQPADSADSEPGGPQGIAWSMHPGKAETLLALGNSHGVLENYSAARDAYARIRKIDPSSPMGYLPASWSFLAEGRLDQAVYWMDQAQNIDRQNTELGGWMVFLNDCLEDYAAAKQWSDWLADRVTNQPQPMAMQARHHYLTGNFELALQYSNLALKLGLPDRWNSNAIFLRIKRDEALAGGDPETGIEVFAMQHPQLFEARPPVSAGNIVQATDLALLLKLAGRMEQAKRLLETVIAVYDQPWFTSGFYRTGLMSVKAEALAILGDKQGALEELRRIIGRGWRSYWRWKTDLNPNFDSIRESFEFRALVGELEADMAMQRLRVQDMAEHAEIAAPPVAGLP